MRTRNYMAIGGSLIGKPPKGFVAVGEPVEQPFHDCRFVSQLQTYSRPLRVVRQGALLVGEERRRVFVDGVPNSVLLPPELLSEFNPTFPLRGLLWSGELLRVDGGCGGDPALVPERRDLAPYFNNRYRVPPEEAWEKLVQATLALGFSAEELDVFATVSAECLNALRECAHLYILRTISLLHPRARLEVYRRAISVLPGFGRRDAASAEARALFDEALLLAITGSTAAGLLAIVALTEPEGGAGEPA